MYQNKGYFDNTVTYEHRSEFIVEALINKELIGISEGKNGQLVRRAKDKYAPDLNVWSFNFITMRPQEEEEILCHIEVEQKINDDFSEFPNPPARWYRWSFLDRKVNDDKFSQQDVYILCNKYPHDKCFWATFGDIRSYCERDVRVPNDRREIYWESLILNGKFINKGYDSLAIYLRQG